MFLFKYARGKSFLSVVIQHRNHALPDDWATIESLINKVNGTTGPLDAVFQHLAMGIKPRKRRQQTRMNIQNAAAIRFDEEGGEQTHVPRKANYLHSVRLKRRDNLTIMFISTPAVPLDDGCVKAPLLCRVQSRRIWLIAHHQGDYCARYATLV